MSWKAVLSFMFFLVVVVLLVFYWILPLGRVLEFGPIEAGSGNFTVGNASSEGMQFYDNMRYQDESISYRIEGCPLGKADEMKRAFDLVQSRTILSFYESPQTGSEEISVTCDSSTKVEGRTFIAGEGGVTNVTATDNFNVIFNGKVLLLRESQCPDPIVGTHELLHALGFDHSENENNIMYPTVSCKQTIGEDLIDHINWIYSFQTLPDLSIEDASASMRGTYLDLSLKIKNHGLESSMGGMLEIYADEKKVKEFEIEPISVGAGRIITLSNIFILKTSADEIKLIVRHEGGELNRENNELVLELKE